MAADPIDPLRDGIPGGVPEEETRAVPGPRPFARRSRFSRLPDRLLRYKDIAWLLLKYGLSAQPDAASLEAAALFEDEYPVDPSVAQKAEGLARDLERLGPAFIKLGQLLSTRADFLPLPYLQALSRLQDKIEPVPFDAIERTVQLELGVRISKAFLSFEETPLATASLGQVHRAWMRDGTPVVLKVQRPGIRERILEDLRALEDVAEFIEKHTSAGAGFRLGRIAGEFRKAVLRELDYRLEARNMQVLGRNLAGFRRILVPRPIEDFTTVRVLTMDYIDGRKVTAIGPLARIDIDGEALAEELFVAYLHQILVDGFFHADPHPGNVFVTGALDVTGRTDARIALLDLGMVGRITPEMQDHLLKLLLAVSEGRATDAADVAVALGDPDDDFDEPAFRRQIGEIVTENRDATLHELEAGRLILDITRIAGQNGTHLPSELTMMAKTLLNLDLVGRTLAADFKPNEAIRRHAGEVMRHRIYQSLSPGNLFQGLLEVKDLTRRLPARINKFVNVLAENRLRVKVDAIDETRLMQGFQKIANRITVGLVLASLIVASAMLMRVQTRFTILGYPGLAMLLFLAAAFGGFALVFVILFSDERGG